MRNQLLRDSDWASMAHSLELRLPLVDTELTRYISRARQRGQIFTKQDLAHCAKPALPTEIASRSKTGFTVPVRDWMQQQDPGVIKAERGLRGWQSHVLAQQTAYTPQTSHTPLSANTADPALAAHAAILDHAGRA